MSPSSWCMPRITQAVAISIAGLAFTSTAAGAKAEPRDPLKTAAVHRYLKKRAGSVSIAVEDFDAPSRRARAAKHGSVPVPYAEWKLNPDARDQTASIVKADILETLLHKNGGPLTGDASADATGMIEDSDNTDATELWDSVGGASGIAAYNRDAGLTQTIPNDDGFWGETMTSAADQIKLLRRLAQPSHVLTPAEQRYQLDLMEHIDPDEDWGVTGGVPKGVTVALKNGWVPLTSYSDWEVNSIGWVRGDHHDYLIAVLTAHDPSEQYGIDTIEHLSALIYKGLKHT
jgi:hypothetical protein